MEDIDKKKLNYRFKNQNEFNEVYENVFSQALLEAVGMILKMYKNKKSKRYQRDIVENIVLPTMIENLLKWNKSFSEAADNQGLVFKPTFTDERIKAITREQLNEHVKPFLQKQRQLPFDE